MNIITGKWKGRKLESLQTEKTRPTLARIKESLFCRLGDCFDGKVCLDLFAGSGALGIEALSRGAKKVYFIDSNPESKKVILKNLKNETEGAQILTLDYIEAILSFKEKFDIVFLDPPYASDFASKAVGLMLKRNLFNDGAILVVEHSAENLLQLPEKECIMKSQKVHSGIAVSIFEVKR